MSSFEFHPNELTIIYNPKTNIGKQTKVYALTVSNHIHEIDCTKTRLTTTLWKEVINMLGVKPQEIINQSHPEFKKIEGNTYTMQGWLDILLNTPSIIKGPIAICNKKAVLCTRPTDILRIPVKKSTKPDV